MLNGRSPKIVRPSRASQEQTTFLWIPGVQLVELVYRDGKLMYAVWSGQEVKYQPNYNGHLPPAWILDVVTKRSLQLPSEAKPHGTIDQTRVEDERLHSPVFRVLRRDGIGRRSVRAPYVRV